MTRPFMEEIALNEQGHALFTRQAGSTIPCPLVDFDGGFNDFMAAAYGLADGVSVADQYGSAFGKPSALPLPCLCPVLQQCIPTVYLQHHPASPHACLHAFACVSAVL